MGVVSFVDEVCVCGVWVRVAYELCMKWCACVRVGGLRGVCEVCIEYVVVCAWMVE